MLSTIVALTIGTKPVLGPKCSILYIKGSNSDLPTHPLQTPKILKSMCDMINLQVS